LLRVGANGIGKSDNLFSMSGDGDIRGGDVAPPFCNPLQKLIATYRDENNLHLGLPGFQFIVQIFLKFSKSLVGYSMCLPTVIEPN
jgi:ABC-type branched-subunit amino acid transport system ATPase component